jgi:hypothetical protein
LGRDGLGRRSDRIYRRMLFFFPTSFRGAFGDQMAQVFRDLARRAATDRRRFGWTRLWWRLLIDTLGSALREHFGEWRTHMSKTALIAAAILALPVLFVVFNLLEYGAGIALPWNPFDSLSSAIYRTPWRYVYDGAIVFSPLVALALVFLPQLRITRGSAETELATIVIRKLSRPAVVLTILSLLVIGILGTYLISENLPCLLGQQISC